MRTGHWPTAPVRPSPHTLYRLSAFWITLDTRSYTSAGENLAWNSAVDTAQQVVGTQWYNSERNSYIFDTLTCKVGAVCGHYTQAGRRGILCTHFAGGMGEHMRRRLRDGAVHTGH
jgi:hypothetical protein